MHNAKNIDQDLIRFLETARAKMGFRRIQQGMRECFIACV